MVAIGAATRKVGVYKMAILPPTNPVTSHHSPITLRIDKPKFYSDLHIVASHSKFPVKYI